MDRGNGRHPEINLLSLDPEHDPAVLGKTPLRNIQFCHDLDAGDHGRLKPFGQGFDIVEDAIDSIANPEQVLKGLEVDIACPRLDRPRDDEVDEPDDRPLGGHIPEVIDILLILSLVGRAALNVLNDLLHGGRSPSRNTAQWPTESPLLFRRARGSHGRSPAEWHRGYKNRRDCS